MDNRKAIYLDDAIDALESKKDKKAKGDIGGFYNKIIQNDIDALMQLPSADPEAAIVKVLKMVEEYKEKTGTDEIIIMPKNGMKAWDENGVEYTMQPTCNNLATDTISRAAAIEVIDAVFPVDPMKSEYAQGIACGAALAKTYVQQLSAAQPYTADIQKIQDLEQAEIEKAFELGREDAMNEIVRCKDCKHHHYDGNIPYCDNIDYGYGWYDNDFCSHAERREE